MIEQAIIYAASVWVLLSWLKIYIKPKAKINKYLCNKCITFWAALALTWNPFTAAVAALIAALVDNYLNNTEITL